MNQLKNFTFLIVLGALFLSSCQKDIPLTGAATYIPAKATSVTGFNMQRIMKKADFEAIKDMEFFKEMNRKASDQNPLIAAVLKDPYKSGIDLDDKIYIATELDKDQPKTMTNHLMIPLSNVGDFESLLKAADFKFEQEDGLTILHAIGGDEVPTMMWNDQLAVISIGNSEEVNIAERTKELFSLKKEESLLGENSFAKAINQDHDMVTWMSTNQLAENPTAGMALRMIDIDRDALRENFVHAYADFNEGEIKGHADFFLTREMSKEIIQRLFKDKSDTDFSKVLPKDQLMFAMKGAMNFRGMDQFLSERPQSKEYADFVINDFAGFERKEIIETLDGDVMVAAYAADNEKSGQFIAAMALKNNGKAEKMLAKAVEDKKLKEVEPGLYSVLALGSKDFSIRINKGMGKFLHFEDMLVYSPNEDLLRQIKDGKLELGGSEVSKAIQHFDDQTMAGWFDFQTMDKEMGDLPANFFKDVRFNLNPTGADFILETTDEDKNSLKAIFEMIEESYLQRNSEAM